MPEPSPLSPYCTHIRSKKLAFAERPPREERDVLDGSGRAWCAHTMDAIGPDAEIVHPEDCQHRRACFVSWGRETAAP